MFIGRGGPSSWKGCPSLPPPAAPPSGLSPLLPPPPPIAAAAAAAAHIPPPPLHSSPADPLFLTFRPSLPPAPRLPSSPHQLSGRARQPGRVPARPAAGRVATPPARRRRRRSWAQADPSGEIAERGRAGPPRAAPAPPRPDGELSPKAWLSVRRGADRTGAGGKGGSAVSCCAGSPEGKGGGGGPAAGGARRGRVPRGRPGRSGGLPASRRRISSERGRSLPPSVWGWAG